MPSKILQDSLGRFVAHPAIYKETVKFCGNCNKLLELRNNRDITRRNYCSHHCRAKGAARTEAFRVSGIRKCARCSGEYTAVHNAQKYCSLACCGIVAELSYKKRRSSSLEGYLKYLIRVNSKRDGLSVDHLVNLYKNQNGCCA